jgi:hypothetical protein
MLRFVLEFSNAFFLRVPIESLLGDMEVWSATLEKWVKRAITFDPTTGSRSNFYSSFRMLTRSKS